MFKDDTYTVDAWYDMMKTAYKHGVNMYDTAEVYGNGQSEENMGGAIKKGIEEGVWVREDLVVSTKIFLGSKGFAEGGPNGQGLSRKHISEGTKASLKRMDLDYVDILFCHRPDPHTPIEESVRAMNFVITRLGVLLGHERVAPGRNQRALVKFAFTDLYKKYKLSLTTWSPLAFGTLTGKYSASKPDVSRFTTLMFESIAQGEEFANRLSIAWAVSNEHVSTVLVAGSRPSQIEENVKALEFVSKITPEVKAKVDAVVKFVPSAPVYDDFPHVRSRHL
ncbi:Voltage-gated potassium channel subunit beta-2 [Phytophthora pseudosyringae]|uniref:Voltage-gated potassium channel subunit beta-2 n=1 Tax=Phytophthora pseudosyringae TaxID=221518 RepID=A0A8T1WEF3_9STRA|nr:Voltage-gated potassium channel subunit beta-2 [Phytophthora pseudosyringae]